MPRTGLACTIARVSPDPRALAEPILRAALAAVEPAAAVRAQLDRDPSLAARIAATRGRVLVVGAGKAGAPMTAALVERLPDAIAGGLVVVPRGHADRPAIGPVRLVEAAHPVPDAAGAAAAAAILDLAQRTHEDDLLVCLLSGGASALLPAPPPPLALEDLRAVTDLLLRSRAAIAEINAVRRHLSLVQGGRLAAASRAPVVALVLSDVAGDPLHDIGSGPTAADPTTFADARDVLVRHGLWAAVPPAVRMYFEAGLSGHVPETLKPGDPRLSRASSHVVASGRHAARAAADAARRSGLTADVLATRVDGEAREFGRLLAALARGLGDGDAGRPLPACWVLSGETTVALGEAAGRGGRNQEAALAAAIALAGRPGVLVACLGTDGTDGNTDAAGALVDGATLARAGDRDPHAALAAHDSHPFLAAAGALLRTGPTLTNVGDLALVLAF